MQSEPVCRLFHDGNLRFLATLWVMGVHVTPTLIDTDGNHFIFISALGALKHKNAWRDPHIAGSADPSNSYNMATIAARVVEHIHKMTTTYLGV